MRDERAAMAATGAKGWHFLITDWLVRAGSRGRDCIGYRHWTDRAPIKPRDDLRFDEPALSARDGLNNVRKELIVGLFGLRQPTAEAHL